MLLVPVGIAHDMQLAEIICKSFTQPLSIK